MDNGIDLFELWEQLVGSVNTHQGGSIKPHRNFVNWVYAVSISLYEEKFQGWEKSKKIIDDLSRPFLKSINIQVRDVPGADYGIMDFPDDYGHHSSARYFSIEGKGSPLEGLPLYDCKGQKYAEQTCPAFLTEDLWEILRSQNGSEKEKHSYH